jgi:hypothetical protein
MTAAPSYESERRAARGLIVAGTKKMVLEPSWVGMPPRQAFGFGLALGGHDQLLGFSFHQAMVQKRRYY